MIYELLNRLVADGRELDYCHTLENLGYVFADEPGFPAAPALTASYSDGLRHPMINSCQAVGIHYPEQCPISRPTF